MIKNMKNNKAVAELVAYVLLISLAIAMSGLVYAWLKSYASKPFAEESCPEVSLIIYNYSCTTNELILSVQNKGRFNVSGYIAKINNETQDYTLVKGSMKYFGHAMAPGKIITDTFNLTAQSFTGKINEIEIEAYRGKDKFGRPILCSNSIIRQSVTNCPS